MTRPRAGERSLDDSQEEPVKLRNLPLRLTTGAYILNSGLDKRGLPEEAAAGMQGGTGAAGFRVQLDRDQAQWPALLKQLEVRLD